MAVTKKKRSQTDIGALMGIQGHRGQTPTHEQIAQRAYQRWEEGGCQPGMAELDWIRAEEELTGASL